MDKIAAPTPEQLKKQEALKQYFEKCVICEHIHSLP